MDEVWVNMNDLDNNECENIYDPIRIKIQDKDRIYLDIGLKSLYALQEYTGSYECIRFEKFMVKIIVEKIKTDHYG